MPWPAAAAGGIGWLKRESVEKVVVAGAPAAAIKMDHPGNKMRFPGRWRDLILTGDGVPVMWCRLRPPPSKRSTWIIPVVVGRGKAIFTAPLETRCCTIVELLSSGPRDGVRRRRRRRREFNETTLPSESISSCWIAVAGQLRFLFKDAQLAQDAPNHPLSDWQDSPLDTPLGDCSKFSSNCCCSFSSCCPVSIVISMWRSMWEWRCTHREKDMMQLILWGIKWCLWYFTINDEKEPLVWLPPLISHGHFLSDLHSSCYLWF